jgi:hypothetical protein
MMTADILYHAMLAAFVSHELDAVKRHEWRVMPLLRRLPDRLGERFFIWAHLPLLLAILWWGEAPNPEAFRFGLSIFAMVHVWLHWLFRKHPAYEFNNASSWALILLTGALGAGHVIAAL